MNGFLKCRKCKSKRAGKASWIVIKYKGIGVNLFKNETLCIDCLKVLFHKEVKLFSDFFTVKEGEVDVNWKVYDQLTQKEKAIRTLLSLNVLSYKAERGWNVVTRDPVGLNPRNSLSYLYFTREQDAVKFAKSRRSYCDVHYIAKVIERG